MDYKESHAGPTTTFDASASTTGYAMMLCPTDVFCGSWFFFCRCCWYWRSAGMWTINNYHSAGMSKITPLQRRMTETTTRTTIAGRPYWKRRDATLLSTTTSTTRPMSSYYCRQIEEEKGPPFFFYAYWERAEQKRVSSPCLILPSCSVVVDGISMYLSIDWFLLQVECSPLVHQEKAYRAVVSYYYHHQSVMITSPPRPSTNIISSPFFPK